MRAYKHTGIQTYGHTGVRTYKHTGIQTYGHTNIRAYKYTGIQIYGHTNIRAYGHTDSAYKRTGGTGEGLHRPWSMGRIFEWLGFRVRVAQTMEHGAYMRVVRV